MYLSSWNFRVSFYFRAFYFRVPHFFSFSRKTNFRATAKKVFFVDNISVRLHEILFLRMQNLYFFRAILFSRTFSCANHSNSRGLYTRAGALRENKTHAKISWTKVCNSYVDKYIKLTKEVLAYLIWFVFMTIIWYPFNGINESSWF